MKQVLITLASAGLMFCVMGTCTGFTPKDQQKQQQQNQQQQGQSQQQQQQDQQQQQPQW